MKALHIGNNQYINTDKITIITGYNSNTMHRDVQVAEEKGKLIKASKGRITHSVIYTNCGYIITSSTKPETLLERFNKR